VDNLARAGLALLRATRDGGPRVFIVKDYEDYRPEELYAAVCRALKRRIRVFRLPLGVLKTLASIGVRFGEVPGLRKLALLKQLMTPQRYCRHLFDKTVPGFHFVSLDEALERMAANFAGSL
jgi:nucleoside-diphosphate-sugar epimerase